MAASSQYHRGAAATVNSHYRPLPAAHEHMYANLATAWHPPHAFARAAAPTASLPRFLNYPAPSDYVNHHSPAQHTWSTTPLPAPSHEWPSSTTDASFTARQLPYLDDEARATVPQASPPARQHHYASVAAPAVPFNAPGQVYEEVKYRPVEQPHGYHPVRSNMDLVQRSLTFDQAQVAAPAPPSLPPQAPSLAPVARLLNYPSSNLHVDPPHEHARVSDSWPAVSNPNMPPAYPTQEPTYTSTTMASDVVLSAQGHLPSSAWGMVDAESGNAACPVYEQAQQPEPDWQLVETLHLQQHDPSAEPFRVVATVRDRRKVMPKKSLAKVTAAFSQRQRKLKVSKRKGPLPEASRIKTHKMRKDRATCLRCRFYKAGVCLSFLDLNSRPTNAMQCDEGEPCQRCFKILGNARSFMLPCTRDRLEDANLVRHCKCSAFSAGSNAHTIPGNGRSNQEEGEFFGYEWLQGSQLYMMEISWNLPMYGPISHNAPPMCITFREYYPNRQLLDTTVSMWTNDEGAVKVVEQPAYAIYDTASFISTFERYFSSMQPSIEAWIFHRVQDDEIALLTYREVVRVRSMKPNGPNNLLDLVMRIQCLSVVSQGYGTIVTQNIPGVREYDYRKMGRSTYEAYDRNSRDRPLTNAINHQMDVAALKYLKKLEGLCLKELKKQMFKSGTKPWYEVFLALYVLFWNMAYIHHGAKKYIVAKNGTVSPTSSSVISGN